MSCTTYILSFLLFLSFTTNTKALMPYTRSLWDMMSTLPSEDPFRILEQSPLSITIPRTETLALARADWKETPTEHVITLDLPGIKNKDVKIEVEENRVLRISGERKIEEEEIEGEKWHRVERTSGKFWRQFRLPWNADMESVTAMLEDGVLRVTVKKVREEQKRQPKVIDVYQKEGVGGEDVKTTTAATADKAQM